MHPVLRQGGWVDVRDIIAVLRDRTFGDGWREHQRDQIALWMDMMRRSGLYLDDARGLIAGSKTKVCQRISCARSDKRVG